MRLALIPILLAGGVSLLQAQAPNEIKWGPAPPFFRPGAQFAVLQGDPSKDGEYTVRLEMPDGYVVAPHYHPTIENVTVISGSFEYGMGDAVSETGAGQFGSGGFVSIPAQMHHWARAHGKTVVQVHGMGPFAITYVKESDDPRKHP